MSTSRSVTDCPNRRPHQRTPPTPPANRPVSSGGRWPTGPNPPRQHALHHSAPGRRRRTPERWPRQLRPGNQGRSAEVKFSPSLVSRPAAALTRQLLARQGRRPPGRSPRGGYSSAQVVGCDASLPRSMVSATPPASVVSDDDQMRLRRGRRHRVRRSCCGSAPLYRWYVSAGGSAAEAITDGEAVVVWASPPR